ncbi:MAG: efflux RND transporter periplasmic adaptor subunit [Azospirillum sp.]|nr:efflux RND transporter periplasmic adaptor subunit [Azospirillum sp.]
MGRANSRGLAALALAVVSALGLWIGLRVVLGEQVPVDRVVRADLVRTIVASGHVQSPYRVEIAAQITGRVADVPVAEGERVRAGAVVALLDGRELDATLAQAQAVLAEAQARLRQIGELERPLAREASIQAEAALRDSLAAYARAAALAKGGHLAQAALDEATRARDVAAAQAASARLRLSALSFGGSEEALVRTQVETARAAVEAAEIRRDYATIRAPRDGILIARDVERGTMAQPGRPLFVLAPDGEVRLVLNLDERNLALLEIGQPAIASADAFPDRRFDAVVAFVNPAVDLARASVEIKLHVPSPPEFLRQDMTVSVDIEVGRRAGALVAPARALRGLAGSAPWVLEVREGRAVRMSVRLGMRGDGAVEILAGLEDGALLVPADRDVLAGARVRTIAR